MIRPRRKLVLLTVLFVLITTVGFGTWIGFRYVETKSSACECEDPVDGKRFSALNPFRNRAPEKAAIQVLEALQQGRCRSIVAARSYCEAEARYKVKSWRLTGRVPEGNAVAYRFWVERTSLNGSDTFGDPVYVWVTRDRATWTVSDVSWYY